MLPASRGRQQSVLSQVSDLASAADDEESAERSNTTNGQLTASGSRRKVNRSNPQMSYAYGAPSDGRQAVKKPRLSKEIGQGIGAASTSPPPAPIPSTDAATRYKAVREKQQQKKQTPATKGSSNNTPRRSARLSTNGSQDATSTYERREAIDAIEEDQAVEEEEDENKASASLAQLKSRMTSSGQSRNVNATLTSVYLDAGRSGVNEGSRETRNGLPNTLLRGAQRLSQAITSPDLNGLITSRSSDFGDSHPKDYDYAEEERYVSMLDQQAAGTLPISQSAILRSPTSRLNGRIVTNGKADDIVGETSSEKRKRKARISADDKIYRPAPEDEESEEMSDVSEGGHKHGHRRRKVDGKAIARAGRDDNKIWKSTSSRKGGRRISAEGNEETINAEMSDDEEHLDEAEQKGKEATAELLQHLRAGLNQLQQFGNMIKLKTPSIPLWTIALVLLLLLTTLGFKDRISGHKNADYDSISGLKSSLTGPGSLSEVSKRIQSLETSFESLRIAGVNAAKDGRSLAMRLANLEDEHKSSSKRQYTLQDVMQEQLKALHSSSDRLEKELNNLTPRLEAMQSKSASEGRALSEALSKRVNQLEIKIKQNEKLIEQISERSKSAERIALQSKDSLQWLEKRLPAEIAVPLQKASGKPSLDAATWEDLRKMFIARDDLDFQRKNEEVIRVLSLDIIDEQKRSGAIISRESFLKLLQEELEKVKISMESQFNANAGEIQNDILAKVRAQQDMFEKAGSWSKEGSRKKSASASTIDVDNIDILTRDGSNAKEAILTLIEEALEVYSADRIARRDYALYSAGARVIPSLTSPTYKLQRPSFFSWTRSSSGRQDTARPPVVALHHDSTPGMCWAFKGEDGQLGIGLARKVIISDVTLEHVPASISLESGTSAPRDVTVWGLLERQSDRLRLAAYREKVARSDGSDMDQASPQQAPPSQNHLLLSSFTYDVHSTRAIQTFPVSLEAKSLQIPISVVQVHITSNHGNKDFTCLYRIRMHGQEWTWEKEQQSSL